MVVEAHNLKAKDRTPMLQNFSQLNWAMLAMLALPLIASIAAPIAAKRTNLMRRPDLGILDAKDYFEAIRGLKAEVAQRRRARQITRQPRVPEHVCVGDFDRSHMVVHGDGGVTVTCAVAGCGKEMVLGRGIAESFVIQSV